MKMGKENRVMGNVETPLTAFLAVFNTRIDKVLPFAEAHATLDSHFSCVSIGGRCESARSRIVPINKVRTATLYQGFIR
jgi:hypothetical protein